MLREYGTDDGGWQTELYPSSVRRRLHLPDHHPGIMVFLTPDGREAHARDAIMTTYELLTTVVANTLSPDEVDPDLRWAFAGHGYRGSAGRSSSPRTAPPHSSSSAAPSD
jgi:glyoxylase-like metal-dependent hydrolase (beta-lactamase superfamily II)